MTATDPITVPGLVHEFDYTAHLKPPVDFGAGPSGHRQFFEATGGRATGERVNGELLTGGGDWIHVGTDGVGRLDVRAQFRTDDGASILAQYQGVLHLNEAVQHAMATGGATDWDDQHFRATPRFETGDERYLWMTQSTFVSVGRIIEGLGVAYRVFRVT